jgi:cytochrome b subunit of formate dehydrogenase
MIEMVCSSRRPASSWVSRLAAAALALALAGLGGTALAQGAPEGKPIDASSEKCLSCHDDPEMKDDDGKSLAVSGDHFARSAHRKLECTDCHAAGIEVRHPRNKLGPVKPEVCQDCHEDEFKEVAGSIHGRRAEGERAIKDCNGCHGSLHTVYKGGDPDSPLSPVNQIKTCGACHEDMMTNYESSEHARALLKMGLTSAAPSCSSCHGTHAIKGREDPTSRTHVSHAAETCGSCHAGVVKDFMASAHAAGLAAGRESPTCSTCHEPHAMKDPKATSTRAAMSDGCGNCHDDVAGTFRNSFHGKATVVGHAKSASCADCHTPHSNLAASDPRSSVHPDRLAETCGACHKDVNASFLSFDPHANPSDPSRNLWLHWIWFGMTGLLIGVFGFFGLHGLLWMQRALVGKMRGEFKFSHHSTGPYVRRFSGAQMGTHIAIVTSFLLLAATGLPLKFAEAPWAMGLMSMLGGAETAGWLHRLAGIVTFGYFAWHLGMLAHGLFVKKEKGYFWGPRSMVPQWQDVKDFVGMMKYFFYLGPRPKFDRFTYWEKFDYLAVFWGVAIIGLSGLVLWFPTVATTVLPGWALNAAYVIHSDEALLATGFIFLFHFFHTHLRPEAFPMDPVVFVGSMPLERFKDERPLEYERMVAEGTLEQHLVPPPTADQLRRAYIFGFIAVAIGVLMAFFIFWGLLSGGFH